MRQLKGWSQEDMAEKLGLSVNGYSNIERGETDLQISRIEEISKTLQVDLLELMSFGEKNIFYQTGTNNIGQYNFINDVQCKHQLDKAQLIIEQKEKEISLLNQQICDLREMIKLLKP
jgi:transcriptional regulator with XRE-family HTH domain